jgi:hypothetical protein
MTVMAVTPMRTRRIVVDRLPVADREREIELMARATDVTLYQKQLTLRAVAHGSLWGDALWAAWMRAEAAVALLDETDETDRRYLRRRREKNAAIRALIHGTGPHVYGGNEAC